MAETTKTTPAGPLREALPPIYPVALIEVACRALEAISGLEGGAINPATDAKQLLAEAGMSAIRIIRAGLASHERAAQEGRSRG